MSAGIPWTYDAMRSLIRLAKDGRPATVVGLDLKRSVVDVRGKPYDLGLAAPMDDGSQPEARRLPWAASWPRKLSRNATIGSATAIGSLTPTPPVEKT